VSKSHRSNYKKYKTRTLKKGQDQSKSKNKISLNLKRILSFTRFTNNFKAKLGQTNDNIEKNLIFPKKIFNGRRSTLKTQPSIQNFNTDGLANFCEPNEILLSNERRSSFNNHLLKYYQDLRPRNMMNKVLDSTKPLSIYMSSRIGRKNWLLQSNQSENLLSSLSTPSNHMKKNKTLLRVQKYLQKHPKLKQKKCFSVFSLLIILIDKR
jgi:hypothetical protein